MAEESTDPPQPTFIQCIPARRTATFNIALDARGYVLQPEPDEGIDDILIFTNQATVHAFVVEATEGVADARRPGEHGCGRHNHAITKYWFNYFQVFA